MSKLATTRPADCDSRCWVASAPALPASRKPSRQYTSTGPCSRPSSSGTSSTMCTCLACSVTAPSLSSSVDRDPRARLNTTTVLTMPDQAADLARLVRERIAEAADAHKAPQMQAYMKSAVPYRGVTAGPLGRIMSRTLTEHLLPS